MIPHDYMTTSPGGPCVHCGRGPHDPINAETAARMMRMEATPAGDPVYLGDGVYAKFERGMIGLMLNDHRSEVLIWLESQVMNELVHYAQRKFGRRG